MVKKLYLLTIDYPCVTFPIGIYPTAKAALAVIAGTAPPHWDHRNAPEVPDVVRAALTEYAANSFVDLETDENRKPLGYAIQEFVWGAPAGFTVIEPYTYRGPLLPGGLADDKVDGEQELIF